ncbi:MAG TPA: ABC transporter substrate-binding protein [Nocardioidaceae bacterium]|nr:ABC transporter substrate-binding protein [Nocardioidaceae bacterium]
MRTSRLVALVAAVMFAASCSGGGGGVDVDGQGGGGSGGGGGTLIAAISAEPDKLDPHATTAYASFQVLENVYDTLVVPNPEDFSFEPSLATEWSTSSDERTWTFQLREGVKFHDGSAFDAADVVYSFNRIIDNDLATAFRLEAVRDIRAQDRNTVVVELKQPAPNLLSLVGDYKGMSILPEGAADEHNLNTEAVGTGPFELAATSPGSIELTANKNYWGEGPFVSGVEFRVVSEPTTALTQLSTGEVHWTDNIPPQQITSLEDDESVTIETVPSVDYWYMSMNFERPPFDDPQVREAVAYGLDREAITETAKFGAAEVNQTAIPEGSRWYYDYAPYSHDPERARQLLQQSGTSNAQMGLMVTDEYPETVQAAQVIKANLAEVGINVSIQVEDFATWLDRQGRGEYDAFMLGWLGNIDPFGFYHAQHTCSGSNNYQNYCDQQTTRLLEQAATETDEDQRKELYDQAVKRIVDDNSYIYLYNPDVVQAWAPDVSGYQIRPDRAINFETVKLGG